MYFPKGLKNSAEQASQLCQESIHCSTATDQSLLACSMETAVDPLSTFAVPIGNAQLAAEAGTRHCWGSNPC